MCKKTKKNEVANSAQDAPKRSIARKKSKIMDLEKNVSKKNFNTNHFHELYTELAKRVN